jgi:uncharacterized protein YbjT (DUF2867 family)
MPLNLQGKTATIFGGTGFVGRYIVARLARAGAIVRVITRYPSSAYFLRTNGVVGQIVPVRSKYGTYEEIERDVVGSDVVVNCLGILAETRRCSFEHVHREVPEWIAQACRKYNVKRFVHISALGAGHAKSRYALSKHAGEKAVLEAYPTASILRPSIIFGPEDNFFNRFASMAQYAPALPLIGGGHTKFQPVYVGDVASAVMATLTRPDTGGLSPFGATYELGGPEIFTFRELFEQMFEHTGCKRRMISLPWALARVQAAFMNILPTPPLTNDQITSLQTDSVVSSGARLLHDLDITPTALETILPTYLDRFRPGGRFAEKKRA